MKMLYWQELKQKTSLVEKKFPKYYKTRHQITHCCRSITSAVYRNKITDTFVAKNEATLFCKNKFCFVCEKIKSNKYQLGLERTLSEVVKNKNYVDFLTLTVPNCKVEDLDKTLRKYSKDWKKARDNLKKNYGLIGVFKSVEITYIDKKYLDELSDEDIIKYEEYINEQIPLFDIKTKRKYYEVPKLDKDGNKMAHPHYHLLLVYDKFDKVANPNFDVYKKIWHSLSGGSVYVKQFKTYNIMKSIQEMTKYLTKETEYKFFTEDEMVSIDKQLSRKQFYGKGGVLDFKVTDMAEEIKIDAKDKERDLNDKDIYELIVRFKYHFITNENINKYYIIDAYWYKDYSPIEQLYVKGLLSKDFEYPPALYEKEMFEFMENVA